jgi:hypothetical protein
VTIAATLDPVVSSPSSNVVNPGLVAWYAEGFADPFGDRLLLFDNAGPALELLRFRGELASRPGFEMAVRRRVDQLADFKHPGFARVRSLTMLDEPQPQLALVSELVRGERLSTLLRAADRAGLRPDPGSAVWLIRQLLPAVGALHDAGAGLPHGTLGPDRIVVTPDGELSITEYPLGGAIERLGMPAANLWRQFGVAGRERGRRTVLDPGTDVAQIALVAVAVLLGRPLRADEVPIRLSTVDEAVSAWRSSIALRGWLARALAPDAGFASAWEALAALDQFVPGVNGAWSSRLIPDAATAGSSESTGLARMSTGPSAMTLGHGRQTMARDAESNLPGGRLALPPGDAAVTRRLWRINGVLTTVALVEAVCLAVLITRYGTTPVQLPAPAPAPSAGVQAAAVPPVPVVSQLAGDVPTAASKRDNVRDSSRRTVHAAPTDSRASTDVVGWILVDSAVDVRVYANGRLLGSAATARYRLPAGWHTITLLNEQQGIRSVQPVRIAAGATVRVTASAPLSQ